MTVSARTPELELSSCPFLAYSLLASFEMSLLISSSNHVTVDVLAVTSGTGEVLTGVGLGVKIGTIDMSQLTAPVLAVAGSVLLAEASLVLPLVPSSVLLLLLSVSLVEALVAAVVVDVTSHGTLAAWSQVIRPGEYSVPGRQEMTCGTPPAQR